MAATEAPVALPADAHEIVVDGYNLLLTHIQAGRPKLELVYGEMEWGRMMLLQALDQASEQLSVVTVFDGNRWGRDEMRRAEGRHRVVFTRGRQTADDFIVGRVRIQHNKRRRCLVVTDDRRLRQRVRELSAHVMGTAEFAAAIRFSLPRPNVAAESTLDTLAAG